MQGMPTPDGNQPCIQHGFLIEQQSKLIADLFERYEGIATVIAVLPEKMDTQVRLLADMKTSLAELPKHETQLAVISEVIMDYKKFKDDYLIIREKVVRMDAERKLVKFWIPIGVSLIMAIVSMIINKLL